MTSISSANPFTNPYYGINQAGGVKPTDAVKQANADATSAALEESAVKKPDAAQEFLDYAKLSVAERIRKQFLDSKGLDEKSLAAMDEKARKAIEDEFRQLLEQKMKDGVQKETEKKMGKFVNMTV